MAAAITARVAVTLYNATGKEVLVLVDGVTVALPTVVPPQIWDRDEGLEQATFSFQGGEFTLAVGSARPDATFELPPEREDACYLVEDATVVRLPYRSDLLAIGGFTMVSTAEDVRAGEGLVVALAVVYRTLRTALDDLEDLTAAMHAADGDELA